jgi:hypothetical protein
MEKLIDTPGQSFYYTTIESFVNNTEGKKKCAVILAGEDLPIFYEKAFQLLGDCINQVIVIDENVNNLYQKIKELSNVLIISASCIKDATRIALNSASLSKNVIYISSDTSKHSIADLLNLIEE